MQLPTEKKRVASEGEFECVIRIGFAVMLRTYGRTDSDVITKNMHSDWSLLSTSRNKGSMFRNIL